MLKLVIKKTTKVEMTRALLKGVSRVSSIVLYGMVAVSTLSLTADPTAMAQTEGSSKLSVTTLEVPSADEGVNLNFAFYNGKDVQYFSAGVGIEERKALYPPYPLKLIFVQGKRAYLAEVTVSIVKSDGTTLVDIPSEHVMGPWLFVNLPSGAYTINATDTKGRAITKQIRIGGEKTRVVHFRWPAR